MVIKNLFKCILVMLSLVLCLGGVMGTDFTESMAGYWNFDNWGGSSFPSTVGGKYFYISESGTRNVAGVFNNAITVSDNTGVWSTHKETATQDDFTISFWMKQPSGFYDYRMVYSKDEFDTDGRIYLYLNDEHLRVYGRKGSSGGVGNSNVGTLNDLDWHNVILTRDISAGTVKVYFDGTLTYTNTHTEWTEQFNDGGHDFFDHSLISSYDSFRGNIDEVASWGKVLTDAEAIEWYNTQKDGNPKGFTSPFTIEPEIETNFTENSDWTQNPIPIYFNSSAIANLSYKLNSDSEIGLCADCNESSFEITVPSGSHSITFYAEDGNGKGELVRNFDMDINYGVVADLINNSFHNSNNLNISLAILEPEDVNISYILDGGDEISICETCRDDNLSLFGLSESEHNISFIVSNSTHNLSFTNFTFTIDITDPTIENDLTLELNNYLTNISSEINCIDLNLALCNITFHDVPTTLEVSTTNNVTFTNNGNQTYTINATDLAGNSISETGTILVNPPFYLYFEELDTTPITDYYLDGELFTSSPAIFNVYDFGLGTHTIEFIKSGYTTGNITFTLADSGTANETYYVPFASIILKFFSIATNEPIVDQNWTIEIIGDDFNNEYTINEVSETTIVEPTMNLGDYTLSVISQDYSTTFRGFSYASDSNTTLEVYLTPKEVLGEVITDVIVATIDKTGQPVTGVPTLQYVWNSNTGEYVSLNEKTTNGVGQTSYEVFLNNKMYKFCADYSGVLYCEDKVIVDSVTLVVYIEVDTNVIELADESNIFHVDFSHSLTNVTTGNSSIVTFNWDNPAMNVESYDLEVWKIVNGKYTLVWENSSSSHSSSIETPQINKDANESFVIKSFITRNGESRMIAELHLFYDAELEGILQEYGLDLIVIILLSFLPLLALNKRVSNISLVHYLYMVIALVVALLFPSTIGLTIALVIVLLQIIAVKFVNKQTEDGQKTDSDKLTIILLFYLLLLSTLSIVLSDLDGQDKLDDLGKSHLTYLIGETDDLTNYLETKTVSMDSTKESELEKEKGLLTSIKEGLQLALPKIIGFADIFFEIIKKLFTIPTTLIHLMGIQNAMINLVGVLLNVVLSLKIFSVYFTKIFK